MCWVLPSALPTITSTIRRHYSPPPPTVDQRGLVFSRVRVVVGKIDIEHGTPHRRLVLPHVLTCSHVLGRRIRGGGGLSRHQLSQRMPRRGFNSSRAPQSPTIRSLYRNSMALLYVQWRWRFQRCPARHVDSRRLHHVLTEDGWLNTTAASSAAAAHTLLMPLCYVMLC